MKKIKKLLSIIIKMFITMAMFVIKPCRMFELFKNVKKGKLVYGCYTMDKLYFKNGKISLDGTDKPVVSIIIPVFNQIDYTYKCLMSIEKYTKDVPYEVIIADDVSFDGTKFIDGYVENVRVNRNLKNTGFLLNCNNAAKIARGKYILFLNNDTEVTENWLSSLVDLIESDNSIGMVGSKLVYPDGRLQEAGGVILSNGTGRNYGGGDDPEKPQYNYVRDVDYISGASIMLSKQLWEQIGGFDERYVPAYCEDSDLAFEVRKAGYRVVYQPKSVITHYEGISNGTDVNSTAGLKHYQIKNNKKLKEKWKEELKLQPKPSVEKDDFKSRDRIKEKGTILVVDHYVPEYDKDAGSRTTFQYLKMFVEEGYTVKFLPDNFYQNEPYCSELEQMGIEVLYGPEYANTIFDWLEKNKDNIDVVYLNRPNIAPKYIDFFKKQTDIKIIYYGHDLHFLREMREYELTGDKEKLISSENSKKIEFSIMKKADCVYYPSYIEEEAIKKIDPTINVKAINAYLFDNVDLEKKYDFENREGIMFVGGFNHTPNVDGVKWFMENVYPVLEEKNIPFTIAGSNPPQVIKDYASDNVVVTGFISDEELSEIYSKTRIVVAPLRYGAGIKGKVVEGMSKGLPLVTTSIGAEGLANTEDILMVEDDPKKFAKAILDIYDNPKKLAEISMNERKYIVDNYSTKAAWNIVKNDFTKKAKYTVVNLNDNDNGTEISCFLQLPIFEKMSDVKLVNLSKIELKDEVYNFESLRKEKTKFSNIVNAIKPTDNAIILANKYLDGSLGVDKAIEVLKAANYVAKSNGNSFVIGSFNSEVPDKVLNYIDEMDENVNFYLTDQESLKVFELLTGRDAYYLPELINFVKRNSSIRVRDFIRKMYKYKNENIKLIGIEISNNVNNIADYINDISSSIKSSIKEKYHLVFINNSECKNEEIVKMIQEKDYTLIEDKFDYSELLNAFAVLDTLFSIDSDVITLAFNSGIVPISYVSKENDIKKINSIYSLIINNDELIIINKKNIETILTKILNSDEEFNEKIEKYNYILNEYIEQFMFDMEDGEELDDNNKDTL